MAIIGLGLATVLAAGCDGDADRSAVAVAQARERPGRALAAGGAACEVAGRSRSLSPLVRETSGLARSSVAAHVLWTHNDAGNDAVLFAVDTTGRLLARVPVEGATHVDWEDIDAAPCAAGRCLYIGDTGDNDGARGAVTLYTLPEPQAREGARARAAAHHARYPDGHWDSEAFFVLPSGDVYLVTKGRRGPVALYRWPAPLREGATVELERVRELWPEPRQGDDRVTAASASPDGRWVAIRTLRTLHLFAADALVGRGKAAPAATVDLAPVGEAQGEAVTLADDGTVWLSSEASKKRGVATLSRLACTLGSAGA